VRTLLSEDQIREGVDRLAQEIRDFYEGRPLTIVGILTGSIVFLADLIRRIEGPLQVALMHCRSYRGAATPGELRIDASFLPDLNDRDVLLVDTIFDTGRTLTGVIAQVQPLKPASLRSAVLLRKHERREVPLEPDHVGFEIPNEFVVGYGLDYADSFRNLPYVAALEPAEMKGS
jgi:hypoxanthine phosphoribosyltransferase